MNPAEDEPKRKRRRSSKGATMDGSSAPETKQTKKLRRSARLSGKAAAEMQSHPAPTTTCAPTPQPSGFVFSAGGNSDQEVNLPCHPLTKLGGPGWGKPAPCVLSAGNTADTLTAARSTHGCPSMRILYEPAPPPDPTSFSSIDHSRDRLERMYDIYGAENVAPPMPTIGGSRDFLEKMHVETYLDRIQAPPMPAIEESTQNPLDVLQNSLSALQRIKDAKIGIFSAQHDSSVATASVQPSSFAHSLHTNVPAAPLGNVETSSSFLNVPQDAVNLWNIARNTAEDCEEDLCRYTGDTRRVKEDQLYTRLNEPATRLSKAILKLRRRVKTAQQSGRTDTSALRGHLAGLEGKRRRLLEEAAARMFLAQNRSRRAFSLIDLHRLTAPAAIKFLTMTLQKAAESVERSFPAAGRHLLMVVTGWGKHSKGKVGTLKHAIVEQLGLACIQQRFNCDFATVNKGAVLVALHPQGTIAEPPSAKDVKDSETLLNGD